MYILSALSILNRPFFDYVEAAETNIGAGAAKNAPGIHGGERGSRTALGVPRGAKGTPSKALPMRSLSKLKKGMGYENACRDLRSLGTHFHIPYLS